MTSGAVLLFREGDPDASAGAETLVLVAASALVTVVRFLVLRLAVFRSPAGGANRAASGPGRTP
ncbi:hypothetical protein GCM10020295_01610 [Streptomyces cinereospinus]